MKIALVKYNAGNTQSLTFALNRLGVDPILTDDPSELLAADKVIFPGQGEAGSAMKYLKEKELDKVLLSLKQPFLGICLGMQLMCDYSEENNTKCLGIIPVSVKRFSSKVKVPHMGWNTISNLSGTIMEGISTGEYLYFVHSYYVEKNDFTIADCEYDVVFSAALRKDNFFAIQPHPEKSAGTGLKILENFIKL